MIKKGGGEGIFLLKICPMSIYDPCITPLVPLMGVGPVVQKYTIVPLIQHWW